MRPKYIFLVGITDNYQRFACGFVKSLHILNVLKSLSQYPWLVRIIWCGIIIFFLLSLVFGYIFSCHLSGANKLARLKEAHALEGRGTTFDDLIAEIPASNKELHDRWWQWQESVTLHEKKVETFNAAWDSDDARKWKLGLTPDPPSELINAYQDVDELVKELEQILDAGPFHAGMAASFRSVLAQDNQNLKKEALKEYFDNWYGSGSVPILRQATFSAVYFACRALGYRVLLGDVVGLRTNEIARYERLLDALSHPMGILETMIFLSSMNRRDEVYLNCSLRRALSNSQFNTWLKDSRFETALKLCGKAYRFERIMTYGSADAEVAHFDSVSSRYGSENMYLYILPWIVYMYGKSGIALSCSAIADVERRIELGPSYAYDPEIWHHELKENIMANVIAPNLVEAAITAAGLQFDQRRYRVAALLVRKTMEGKTLPLPSEIRTFLGENATLLDPSDDQCAITYDRLTDGRFTLAADLVASTDGVYMPLSRYRASSTMSPSPAKKGTLSPRTDIPPKPSSQIGPLEIWIPNLIGDEPKK